MADRIIHGTLDTFNDKHTKITYKGPGAGIDRGLNIHRFGSIAGTGTTS